MRTVTLTMAVVSMFLSVCVSAADSTGQITLLRASSDSTQHPASNRDIMFFKLSVSLHTNCTWLRLNSNNGYFASTVLMARATEKLVRIWYDEVGASGGVCEAYTIEVID